MRSLLHFAYDGFMVRLRRSWPACVAARVNSESDNCRSRCAEGGARADERRGDNVLSGSNRESNAIVASAAHGSADCDSAADDNASREFDIAGGHYRHGRIAT
jgi:hypothetical protein